jgi:adenylate kinase
MNIVIIGPQGSGKTTQAKLLAKHLALAFIDVGEIFRNLAKENKEIHDAITKGDLADDELTFKIVHQRLQEEDTSNGFIIDDFPKTLAQAKLLGQAVDIHLVLHFRLSDDECTVRLLNRKRKDDVVKKIAHRLEVYRDITEPLTEFYRPQHIVHSINASRSIQEVFREIMRVVRTV